MPTSRVRNAVRRLLATSVSSLLLLAMLPTHPPNRVQAFMPYKSAAWALAFSAYSHTHQSMTQEAIKELDNEFFGIKKLTSSMKNAMNQIVDADMAVDDYNGDQFKSAKSHFDGEAFPESQQRLVMFAKMAEELLKYDSKTEVEKARWFVGQALHTLQDFYSHSNWVELGNSGPHPGLGRKEERLNIRQEHVRTCTDCARNTCADCNDNIITNILTTGYYGGDDRPKPSPFKCSHGGRVTGGVGQDESGSGTIRSGINKDTLDCEVSPHHNHHNTAAGAAKEATKNYFRMIKDNIGVEKMKKLLGVGPTLSAAIDTTGSMGSVIAQVKQQTIGMARARVDTDEEPSKYVLVPFNDPDVGPVTETDSLAEFEAAINALSAGGGGDCPERSTTGLFQAVNATDEGGSVLLFTDATSNDNELAANVSSLARDKNVKVFPMLFGSCSPIDPGYIRIANETGGQIFLLSTWEAGEITKLADFIVRANAVDLLSIIDAPSGAPRAYTVPVDSTMARVTFSVSGSTNVTLKRPDGTVVQAADAGTSNVAVSTGSITSVTNPAAGAWQLIINDFNVYSPFGETTGEFSINVTGESGLDLDTFRFVERRGRALHEGFFPINGSPLAGQTVKALAELTPERLDTASFELRTRSGAVLQTLSLEQNPTNLGVTREYLGDVTLPDVPFLVYAVGTTTDGTPFQRALTATTKAQTVRIVAPPLPELRQGQTLDYVVRVENAGQAGTFNFSGFDDEGFIAGVSPETFALGANQTADVTVRLRVPADAKPGTYDKLIFSVQSASAPDVNNSAIVETVVPPGPGFEFVSSSLVSTDGDEFIEPGEVGSLGIELRNNGIDLASGVRATLSSDTAGVTVLAGQSAYPDLNVSDVKANSAPFTFSLAPNAECGRSVNFSLTVNYDGAPEPHVIRFAVAAGQPADAPSTVAYTGPPVTMPFDPNGVNIPLQVDGLGDNISDLDLMLDSLDYFYVGGLEITLTSPRGTSVRLVDQTWSGGANFRNTLLDDEGASSVRDVYEQPHTGTFRPVQPLAAFKGEDPNGTWVLNVKDPYYYYYPYYYYWWYDLGRVNRFSLLISGYECNVVERPRADLSLSTAASPDPVVSGSTVTYTTTVSNNGPNAAESVTVTSTLPANTTLISCVATGGGTCAAATGTATIPSLAAGGTATVTVVAAVDCPAADGTTLGYTTSVASLTEDPNLDNNTATAAAAVSNPAPVIANASVDQPEIWPPNHRMVDITVSYDVTDNCGPLTNTLSVESNEPVNENGDGNTAPDWEIVGAHHVRVRAERAGGGNGRVYTITITSTDSAGNSSSRAVTVRVPKSKGK